VDDIAIVKSMHTDAFNHAPGQSQMCTGTQQFGRPSVGAWTTYGLGSESQDLPAFVVFSTGAKGPSGGASNWGAGFLPSVYQGVMFRSVGDPVLYLSNPKGVDRIGTLEGYGQPEDIARAVEYFVTDAGRHVSGQVLRVDGGDQTWPA